MENEQFAQPDEAKKAEQLEVADKAIHISDPEAKKLLDW